MASSLENAARFGTLAFVQPRPVSNREQNAEQFEAAVKAVLIGLGDAVRRLVASSPTPIARATDLQRLWGLRSLAWQVFRWSTADDPFASVPRIPQPEAMTKILAAARQAGFHSDSVADMERAYAGFIDFVSFHAGDRGTFDGMVSALGREASDRLEIQARRAAYRANARIWGLHAQGMYYAYIHQSGPTPVTCSSMFLKGWMGLRALRRMESLLLGKRKMNIRQTDMVTRPQSELIVLHDFCSPQGLEIRTLERDSVLQDSLYLSGIGRSTTTNCFVAVAARDWPVDPNDDAPGVIGTVDVPSELLIVDLLIPVSHASPADPFVKIFGCLTDSRLALSCNEEYRLPAKEAARYLGTSLDSLRSPELPSCPEMIYSALRQVGWRAPGYHLYRARIRYPILHSCVALGTRQAAQRLDEVGQAQPQP
jgi:hypothetical protein